MFQAFDNILSALELLPNEVFEMILKNLDGHDLKNLRMTSSNLCEKTTSMAAIFKDWCFQASRTIPFDLMADTSKKFRVKAIKDEDNTSDLIKRFVSRFSGLRINFRGVLLNNLERKPAAFLNVTSLDLENVTFSVEALLVLAPQLENLRLVNIKKELDISSVDKDSKAFSKLKNLKLENIQIDLTKILTNCCKTLESFELNDVNLSDDLEEELSSLTYLSLTHYIEYDGSELCLGNLLSKCSRSLRTLRLEIIGKVDFSKLLKQPMNITTLKIRNVNGGQNFEKFLNKCPLIQNLFLGDYRAKEELNKVVLKDLTNLDFTSCNAKCINGFLKYASSSLKTLHFNSYYALELQDLEIPVIPKLDTFSHLLGNKDQDLVSKLFPTNVQVIFYSLKLRLICFHTQNFRMHLSCSIKSHNF